MAYGDNGEYDLSQLTGGNTGFTGGAPAGYNPDGTPKAAQLQGPALGEVGNNNGLDASGIKTPGSRIAAMFNQFTGRNLNADPNAAGTYGYYEQMDPAAAEAAMRATPEAQAYLGKNAAPAGAGAPGGGYSGGSGPIASAQGANPQLGQLRNMLMGRANQSLTVDPNDPTIKAQTDAYRADVTRGGRDFLSQQAESAGPINNMNAAYRSVGEKAGQATAGYRGKLMQGMVDARRQEISQALSGLYGTLSLEEQTRLRQEDQDLQRQRFGADTAQQAFDDQYKTIFG